MDRRKMKPTTEEKDGQVIISFNPEIDPELKKYSDESIKRSSDAMKYSSLKLWSSYRFEENQDNYKQYQQYENNHQLVISETKEIIEGLKTGEGENFYLFNGSIPAYTCSVLIRDVFDKLNEEDGEYCKEVIIEYASIPLQTGRYSYQISDGTEPSIVILPDLIRFFPKDKERLKSLLFLLLLNPWREISSFAIRGILHNLWEISFDDAHSIFLGYLLLKPKYEDLRGKIRKENYGKKVYEHSEAQVLDRFLETYKNEIERVLSNKINDNELENLDKLDLEILKTAFEILPLKIENEYHKTFLNDIFPVFSKKLLIDDDRIDYTIKHRILEKFAYFILNCTKNEIHEYLKPFVDNFSNSREMANFFQEFITVEDRINKYEEFWTVWNVFYHKIVEICKKQSSYHYTKEIVYNYLLAWPYWREDAKEWHTLKEREKVFFKKVVDDIGDHPSVLYSVSKVLNDIGSNFIEDGIISERVNENETPPSII